METNSRQVYKLSGVIASAYAYTCRLRCRVLKEVFVRRADLPQHPIQGGDLHIYIAYMAI